MVFVLFCLNVCGVFCVIFFFAIIQCETFYGLEALISNYVCL